MSLRALMSGVDREMLGKVSSVFLLRILGAGAQLAFTVLLARLYGAEGMGVFILGVSFVLIASTVSRWGLDQAALKHIAVYAGEGNRQSVRSVFAAAFLAILFLSLGLSLLLMPALPWLAEVLFSRPDMTGLLYILALSIVPFSLLNLTAEALRGMQRTALNALIQVVVVPVVSICAVLVLQDDQRGVLAAAYAYLWGTLAASILGLFVWRLYAGSHRGVLSGWFAFLKGLLDIASPMAWVSIIGIAMSLSETVLLGVFRDAGEVGVYAAALRVAMLVNFILVAFNTILAPRFAALFHQNRLKEMELLAAHSVQLMLFLSLPVFVVCLFFPEQVLGLFGNAFSNGAVGLMILAIGQLVNVATGPVGVLLLMTGYERHMRRNWMLSALVGLVAGLLLVPPFGVIGASISAVIAGVILQGLLVWSVKRNLNINIFPYLTHRRLL